MRRPLLPPLAGLLLLVLAGCGGPNQAERRAQVDEAWRQVVATADRSVATLIASYPDLTLVETQGEFSGERWQDCSGSTVGDAVSPTDVIWTSSRDVQPYPARETASLADSLADRLVAEGWTALRVEDQDGGRSSTLTRDDLVLTLISSTVVPERVPPIVRVIVRSVCVPAPERMIDWTPPTDAPTPTTAPTG